MLILFKNLKLKNLLKMLYYGKDQHDYLSIYIFFSYIVRKKKFKVMVGINNNNVKQEGDIYIKRGRGIEKFILNAKVTLKINLYQLSDLLFFLKLIIKKILFLSLPFLIG